MYPQLSCYYLKVRERFQRRDVDLFAFDGTNDLLIVIENWLNELKGATRIASNSKRTIHFEQNQQIVREGRIISNRIQTGKTGIGSNIYRNKNLDDVTHKGKNDIDAIPTFFMFDIPTPGQVGYFVCLDYDGLCPYGVLSEFIKSKFKANYPDHTLRFEPIVFDSIMNEYINDGLLVAVELKRKGLKKDHAEQLCDNSNDFGNPQMSLSISADTRHNKKFSNLVYKTLRVNLESGEKRFLDFNYDEAFVNFKLKGITRKIKVQTMFSRANKISLPDNIQLDLDGIPDYDAMCKEAKEIINNLK